MNIPALQSIHKLPGRFQAFAHEMRLLPYHRESIFKQPSLIFHCWRGGHGDCMILCYRTMACEAQAAVIDDVERGSKVVETGVFIEVKLDNLRYGHRHDLLRNLGRLRRLQGFNMGRKRESVWDFLEATAWAQFYSRSHLIIISLLYLSI